MPFTPAHPAIILPFVRNKYFSATALIIGSIAPDFEYFFKMSVESDHSHTIAGLFYFNLPVVFLLSAVFHLVVKKKLIHNLPVFIQKRFGETLILDFPRMIRERFFVFAASALLGAASHIFWDSFTHEKGYFARSLWFYEGTFVPFEGANYPLFYALQHISTIVGLILVVSYIILKKETTGRHDLRKPNILYWLTLVTITSSITWLRFFIKPNDGNIGNFVVAVISACCIGLVCCGLIRWRNPQFIQTSESKTDK